MYNPTFGQNSLDRQILKSDFKANKSLNLDDPDTRKALVQEAVELAKNGLTGLHPNPNDIAGRKIYTLTHFPTELVLRKATENLSRISRAKQANRISIIQRLALFCREGIPYCVAKFDIKQFYQSIDHNKLKTILHRRLATAPSTRFVLDDFIDRCSNLGIEGLPAGLSISAILAEMYMQDFDKLMKSDADTHFYARYVDDIIIIRPSTENQDMFKHRVIEKLPYGLHLNTTKTKFYVFPDDQQKNPITEHKFNYLGFSFDVWKRSKGPNSQRNVLIDIAQSKVDKLKTRIIKSLLQFKIDNNYDDLRDRLRLICGNYKFYDYRKSRIRFAGTSHTYSLIQQPSNSLKDLDDFKHKVLLAKSGRICRHLSFTNKQRKELLNLSFSKCYSNQTHFHFSAGRLKKLMECWKYA